MQVVRYLRQGRSDHGRSQRRNEAESAQDQGSGPFSALGPVLGIILVVAALKLDLQYVSKTVLIEILDSGG